MEEILFSSVYSESINAAAFFEIILAAIVIGLGISFAYSKTEYSGKSFLETIAVLPVITAVVIMMVNGNLGAGVAVAGAFSLVRFRSAQGTGKEISVVFLDMAAGLALGMGFIFPAIIFSIAVMVLFTVLSRSGFGKKKENRRVLKITVPETLEFDGMFDDILEDYTTEYKTTDIRTAGMGSVYKLTYEIEMKDESELKQMIDEIRERNGNLEISCSMWMPQTQL